MDISLCVICKNEEQNIKKCLNGVSAIVNEMIVVDTGSTDRTVEIAKQSGAQVFHYEWDNNFSNAKNYALEQAKNDWIIFLDADEYILPKDARKIVRIILEIERRDNSADAFVLKHISVDDKRGLVIETNNLIRVFRRSTLRYRRAIHESLYKKGGLINIADATQSDVAIYHSGYSFDRMEMKAERNLELLKNELRSGESTPLTPLYLSDSYMALQDYTKAIEYATQFIESGYSMYGFNARPYSTIIRSLVALDSGHKLRREWISEALVKFPGHPDFIWLKGIQHLAEEEFSDALKTLLDCISYSATYKGNESVTITRVLGDIYAHIGYIYILKNDELNAFEFFVKGLKEQKYLVKAFHGLITIVKTYPIYDAIFLINSIYGESEEDISFIVQNLAELRHGKLLLYYSDIWRNKFKKEDAIGFYTLYLNKRYEESFKLIFSSLDNLQIDKITQVYIVVTALLSMNEEHIRQAWSVVNSSYQRIIEVYQGKRTILMTEDSISLVDLFSEMVRVCSDEELELLFSVSEYHPEDFSIKIAAMLINQEKYTFALTYFGKCKKPFSGEGLFLLGVCYFRLGLYPKSIEIFNKAKKEGFLERKIDEYLNWAVQMQLGEAKE